MERRVVGDTSPDYTFKVVMDNQAVDLSNSTVKFILYKPSGDPATEKDCTLVDADNGVCSVTFDAADWDESGLVYGDLKITFDSGQIQHGANRVVIRVREEGAE